MSLYNTYYTGSDVTVDLYYPPNDKRVNLDKAVGIGFSHNVSTMPVYGLGVSDPAFFTKGNSIVQGQLDLAFNSHIYMQTAINYLLNISTSDRLGELTAKFKRDKKSLSQEEYAELSLLQSGKNYTVQQNSISSIAPLLDIYIDINNSNSQHSDSTKTIVIYGVKIADHSMSAHSSDEGILVDRYSFMAKNIK